MARAMPRDDAGARGPLGPAPGAASSARYGGPRDGARLVREFAALRPAGGFSLIMADPPWRFLTYGPKGRGRSAERHYPTMTLDEIAALPVATLAAPDCLLWLWATNPLLPWAFEIVEAWGFEFRTAGHWVKRLPSGRLSFGTGYILRSAGEPFLIAVRGAPRTARTVRSVIDAPPREHSRKPDEAYAAAEALMPEATRIELFSRESRPGWTAWGLEAGKFDAPIPKEIAAE